MQFVDLKAQHDACQPELSKAIARVIQDSSFVRSSDVENFEQKFAALTGAKHCVSCANGTDALYIAMRALGVGPGDEVITTAHSWISTSETITQTGANVVFVDTEADFFCIDPEKIEEKITERTKGVILVHLYGQPADAEAISAITTKHGLWLIEDCAQAHLASLNGKQIGSFGDVATFSFYPGKNLGAMGDAGCLNTDRDDVAKFSALFARHGGKGNHVIEGICSRLDGIQAAVLNVKMNHLFEWTKMRQAVAARYETLLTGIPGIVLPKTRQGAEHVWHLYVIRAVDRDGLRAHLNSAGIPTGIHYDNALPFYTAYDRLRAKPADFPVAHAHAAEILSLPMHPYLEKGDQELIAEAVTAYYMK